MQVELAFTSGDDEEKMGNLQLQTALELKVEI